MKNYEQKEKMMLFYLIIVFVILAIGIVFIGRSYFKGYEKDFRTEVENELRTEGDLKVNQLVQWRKERLQDGNIFYKNEDLTEFTKRFIKNENDLIAKKCVETWLSKVYGIDDYEAVYLLDSKLNKKIIFPEKTEESKAYISLNIYDSLKSNKIVFEDFYFDEALQKIFLKILIPILDNNNNEIIGIIGLRIAPYNYLYPMINESPLASKFKETILIRREGDEIIFLNELRYQKNSALNLKIPLTNNQQPTVKAVQGETGIVEGVDNLGIPVVAYIRDVPNSPWFLVTKTNKAELYAPLKEKLIESIVIALGIFLSIGLGFGFIWRHQRVRFYKERYNSSEALRESEERFRLLYERAPTPYQSLDSEGKILEVNNAWLETLGYKLEEVIGHKISEFLVPEHIKLLQERFPKFLEAGYVKNAEFDFKSKEGKIITVSVEGRIGFDEEGKFKQTHCVLHNITERKQAEETLKKSEEKYRSLFENMQEGYAYCKIILEDGKAQDFIYLDVNEAFEKLTGLKNVKNKKVSEVIPNIRENDSEIIETYGRVALSGSPEKFEIFISSLQMWFSVSVYSPLKEYFVAVFDVITERKKAEQEILKLNRVYQVLSNINQAIVRIDDINKLFNDAVNIAVEDGKFIMSWIGVLNEKTNKVDVLTSAGITQDYFEKINIDLNDEFRRDGPSGTAIKTGKNVISNDIANDDKMAPWRDDALKIGYKSSASFPIKVFGKVFYIFNLYSDELNYFDEDEIKLLEELASDISFALEFVEKEKERKKFEEALIESEERWRSIVENEPECVKVLDREGHLIEMNPAGLEMIQATFEQVKGQKAVDLVAKEDKDAFNEMIDAVFRGETRHLVFDMIGLEGRRLTLETISVPIKYPDPTMGVKTLLGVTRDITEHKKFEEALKISNNRNRSILECAGEGIIGLDKRGYHTFVNPKAAEMLGYREDELIKLHSHSTYHHSYPNGEVFPCEKCPIYETLLDGKNHYGEEYLWKKDGTGFWVLFTSMPILENGIIIGAVVTFRDITSQKKAEESLKSSEEKYRNLIETMPEAFYRSTAEGYFVDVNPALVKMFGYESKEELMNVFIPDSFYFSKDERDNALGNNVNFIPETEIYKLKKKDGSEIWVEDHSRYIKDGSGKIIFHEGIMRDVTESLRAKKAIIEAKDKAEEMSRLKSSFLANMSHEIRTPLNGILGFTELLKDELTNSNQIEYLNTVEKGGRRLLETLDLILNFSKLESEMINAQYNNVNVGNVIIEVVNNFEAMAKNKGLILQTNIQNKNFTTNIDDRFLRHILNNLVKNAIVYTDTGEITVELYKIKNEMIIKVNDTGIGIAKENFDMIFEPFRQESEGYDRNFEGTGLGLSISKRFVEMMNGTIGVDSTVGVGSTFTVKIPLKENNNLKDIKMEKEKSRVENPLPAPMRKDKLSILLVENDDANLQYTLAVLNKNYDMDFTLDGLESIEMAKKKVYDIILMDINLGKGIDGLQAVREIRKLKEYEKTPIVALTAFVRDGDKEEFFEKGCTHYLGKPFKKEQLLNLINGIVV